MFLETLLVTFVSLKYVEATHWSYSDIEEWKTLYPTCDGTRQSPIAYDINNVDLFTDQIYNCGSDSSNLFTFDCDHSTFRLTNNGHGFGLTAMDSTFTTEMNTATNTIGRIKNTITQDYNPTYCLHGIHAHFGRNDQEGSEHFLNGKQYPLEMHFVYFSCDFDNFDETLDAYETNNYENLDTNKETQYDTNVLAVISVLFDVSDDIEYENEAFKPIVESVNDILNYEDSIDITINDICSMLVFDERDLRENYINDVLIYEGSLTTPPCYEIVLWHLNTQVLEIGQRQLDVLRDLNYFDGFTFRELPNFRDLNATPMNNNDVLLQQCSNDHSDTHVIPTML